jgi:hypothetical protein
MISNICKIRLWAIFGLLHLASTVCLALYLSMISDGQGPFLWGIFAVIDFPVTLLYYFSSHIQSLLDVVRLRSDSRLVNELFYFPFIVHALFGSVWWAIIGAVIGRLTARVKCLGIGFHKN